MHEPPATINSREMVSVWNSHIKHCRHLANFQLFRWGQLVIFTSFLASLPFLFLHTKDESLIMVKYFSVEFKANYILCFYIEGKWERSKIISWLGEFLVLARAFDLLYTLNLTNLGCIINKWWQTNHSTVCDISGAEQNSFLCASHRVAWKLHEFAFSSKHSYIFCKHV